MSSKKKPPKPELTLLPAPSSPPPPWSLARRPVAEHVRIDYTNYRGERSWRKVIPGSLSFRVSPYHIEPQWILHAWDLDKADYRDFAMSGVHAWDKL